MNKVSAILPISREEAQSLLRLIPHLDRLTAEPDGQAVLWAEFQALQAMFYDVLQVLNTKQRQQLAEKWRAEQLPPLWLQPDADQADAEAKICDAANSVLLAGLQILERTPEMSD